MPSLIVMNARGASLQGGKLTLTGVSANAIVFADRPVRAAGHSLTTDLLEEWSPGNTDSASFTKDPPNATVSAFSKEGSGIRDAVVVLKTAKLEGDRLTFDVDVLEGDLPGPTGRLRSSSIASDLVASTVAGSSAASTAASAAWRLGHVGAVGVSVASAMSAAAGWYRGVGAVGVGAAALGGAAIGAAAASAYHPYGYPAAYPYPGACGYYPYPPCY